MTETEFAQLSEDLQSLVKLVPLNWGFVQNDKLDSQIDLFNIHSFIELERQITALSDESKNYFRRRWFMWKNAQCDEHLFCTNTNVTANPNLKDQTYDIEFNANENLRFDVKGTVIPKCFRNKIDVIIEDPTEMVNYFYYKQSTGVRSNVQNRLFLIHHSFRNQERERMLRCHWVLKKEIYKSYAASISANANFIKFNDAKADVIFIFENLDKTFTHNFFAVK